MIGLARAWVTVCTAPLPPELRQRRRFEILADVEDQLADGDGVATVLARMARGAVHDISWSISSSVEHAHPVRAPRSVVLLGAPMLVLLWLLAEKWHRHGGSWAAVSTAGYAVFWLATAAAVCGLSLFLIRSLHRWSQR